MTDLLRYSDPKKGIRLGCRIEDRLFDLTEKYTSLTVWLQATCGRVAHAIQELEALVSSSPASFSYADLNRPAEPGRWYPCRCRLVSARARTCPGA